MIESAPSSWSAIELLDLVLGSGIVIDSAIRVSPSGIDLLADVVVVVSTTVYLKYATLPISSLRSHAIASEVTPAPPEGTP